MFQQKQKASPLAPNPVLNNVYGLEQGALCSKREAY